MKLVRETSDLRTAFGERADWRNMGHPVRITEVKKIFRGAYQIVYRVWVGERRQK